MFYWTATYRAKPGRAGEQLMNSLELLQPIASAIGVSLAATVSGVDRMGLVMSGTKLSDIADANMRLAAHPDLVRRIGEGLAENTELVFDERVWQLIHAELPNQTASPYLHIVESVVHRGKGAELRPIYQSFAKAAIRLGARSAAFLGCQSGPLGGVSFVTSYDSADQFADCHSTWAGDSEFAELSAKVAPLMIPGHSQVTLANVVGRVTP